MITLDETSTGYAGTLELEMNVGLITICFNCGMHGINLPKNKECGNCGSLNTISQIGLIYKEESFDNFINR